LGQLKIKKLKLPRYFAVFFNQNQSKQLSDKNVRMALSYATDKEKILKEILSDNGTIVDSPMLPGIINIPDDAEKYNFDIEKAKKTLDDAGWKLSETDGVREKAAAPAKKGAKPAEPTKLEIRLTTSNWPELTMVADQIKKQWEAAGAKVNVETLDLSELQQVIRDRDYEALLFGEVLGLDPDPLSFWHSSQKRDPGLNLALYDNKDADKLLEDARLTQDKPARLSKYDDFQKTVAKDVPAIFLYSPDYLYAQPAKIKNNNTSIVSIPSDRFATVNQWYINTRRVSR
jgi:peptide/nickel transport system substrate-binding protein